MSYSWVISEVIKTYNSDKYVMVAVTIKHDDGRFNLGQMPGKIRLLDATLTIPAFMMELSLNQKELIGYFLFDVFLSFQSTGPVSIDFVAGQSHGVFQNINPMIDVISLSPALAALGLPPADNAWLAALT